MEPRGGNPDLSVRDELDNSIWRKRGDVGGPTFSNRGIAAPATDTPPPWSPRPCEARHRPRGHPTCKQIEELARTSIQALKSQGRIKDSAWINRKWSSEIQRDGWLDQHTRSRRSSSSQFVKSKPASPWWRLECLSTWEGHSPTLGRALAGLN
jgi:hypothetical protein